MADARNLYGARMDRMRDSEPFAELVAFEEELLDLSRRMRAFLARHPDGQCRCALCVFVRHHGPDFPTALDTLGAAAVTLHTYSNELNADRPLTHAETKESTEQFLANLGDGEQDERIRELLAHIKATAK